MQKKLECIRTNRTQTTPHPSASEIVKEYQHQLDLIIPIENGPEWIFDLLQHFKSDEQSELKSLCEKNPDLAENILFYLDDRYKFTKIMHNTFHNSAQSWRLIKQRLEFNPKAEKYSSITNEVFHFYMDFLSYRKRYYAKYRSDSHVAWLSSSIHTFFSTLILFVLMPNMVVWALYLSTMLNTVLSIIEWGLLDLMTSGQYTENLKELPMNKEHFFFRLRQGLEPENYEQIDSVSAAKKAYLESKKQWPPGEEHVNREQREYQWGNHLNGIYREQDRGIDHLALIVNTFYKLATAPLSDTLLMRVFEIFFRLSYIALAGVFLALALGILLLTEYLPILIMSLLVITASLLEYGLHMIFTAPFYKRPDSPLEPTASTMGTSTTSKPNETDSKPSAVSSKTTSRTSQMPSYFLKRCSEVNDRLRSQKDIADVQLSA